MLSPALFATMEPPTNMSTQTDIEAQKNGGLVNCNGNPARVGCALGTHHPPSHPRASRGLAKSSRDAALPAKPAGSARVCPARTAIDLVQLMNNAG